MLRVVNLNTTVLSIQLQERDQHYAVRLTAAAPMPSLVDISQYERFKEAGESILANRLVTTSGGLLYHADCAVIDHLGRGIGFALTSADIGGMVKYIHRGEVENPSWVYIPDQLLYLGNNGQMTADPELGVFCQPVGYALTATRVFLDIERGTVL